MFYEGLIPYVLYTTHIFSTLKFMDIRYPGKESFNDMGYIIDLNLPIMHLSRPRNFINGGFSYNASV